MNAIKFIVTAIKRINIFNYWKNNEKDIKIKIHNLIKISFGKHLNEFESYRIYHSWKKNYR